MSAVCTIVDVDTLVELFVGGDGYRGHPSVKLVDEICRRVRPESVTALRLRMFGDVPPDMIGESWRCAVAVAYADWVNHGRPE